MLCAWRDPREITKVDSPFGSVNHTYFMCDIVTTSSHFR
jgi:hypothetical protein